MDKAISHPSQFLNFDQQPRQFGELTIAQIVRPDVAQQISQRGNLDALKDDVSAKFVNAEKDAGDLLKCVRQSIPIEHEHAQSVCALIGGDFRFRQFHALRSDAAGSIGYEDRTLGES